MTDHPPPIRLSVNITKESAETLRNLAQERGQTISEIVRDAVTDHPPPTGDEAPNLLLPPDAARAVAALIAAGEDIIFLVGDLDQYDHCEPCDVCNRARRVHAALADPALAAVRRTLAGEG